MIKRILRLAFFVFLSVLVKAEEPITVYLSWVDDPTSTMVVQWMAPEGSGNVAIHYHASEESRWKEVKGESKVLIDCHLYRIDLKELTADQDYVFKFEGGHREYRFRTMPKQLSRPVRFAVGGDIYYTSGTEMFQRMNRVIGFNRPDFVVLGGDLAYTTGTKHLLKGPTWALRRWQSFLRQLQGSLGEEGRLIPILPLVGNHDVHKPKNRTGKPELFYEIFAFPENNKAYRSLRFGDYLSLVMLDTGHTWPVEGDQTEWLEKTLQEKSSSTYLLAAYHVAAYPSYYPLAGNTEEKIRKNWVPLFEKYHLPFAFEHHNHTFKRTHPLKEGKIDSTGVIYLGDGSWGVPTRHAKSPKKVWYLAKSASVNSCYLVTLTEKKCLIEAKNTHNETIDQVEKLVVTRPEDLR